MIEDMDTQVTCTHCKKAVMVADAIHAGNVIARQLGMPQNGVYIYCSQDCKEKHMIARQLQPIMKRLPPQ